MLLNQRIFRGTAQSFKGDGSDGGADSEVMARNEKKMAKACTRDERVIGSGVKGGTSFVGGDAPAYWLSIK